MPKCLSDTAVRNAKPKSKPYKMFDGDGLFLLVMPSGSKYWRMKYFFGKEKTLAFGVYPDVSLSDAREKRSQARKTLAAGKDPGEVRKEAKRNLIQNQENTFEVVAREWLDNFKSKWTPDYVTRTRRRLELHLFPRMGDRPIADITSQEMLSVLREIEPRGNDVTHRMLQVSGQVFTYAVVTGRAANNPSAMLHGALKPLVKKNFAYIKPNELPEFLRKLDGYDGELLTKLAMKLLLLTFVRTGELRGAEWLEIDFDKAEWRIPPERMKKRKPHLVPLSRQALEVLKQVHRLSGQDKCAFPNSRNPLKQMSENTILYALYRMGYHSRATGHGFRSTASTILYENGFRSEVIETQLAHIDKNKVRAAYNHAQYLPERREMMQWWADYLDQMAAKKPSK